MNDGPQNPGQPDPEEMAEQLRRMMQQLGLPVSGDLTSFMTQLSQMFGSGSSVGFGMPGTNPSDGPVDWSHIKDMARHITASHGPDPAPGQQERTVLLDASRLAESWLDRECEFAQVNVSQRAGVVQSGLNIPSPPGSLSSSQCWSPSRKP